MKERLKTIGGILLGFVLLAAIMFAFDFGVAHFYTTVTVLYQIELWMATLLILIFLPVSIFRRNRAWCAYVFKGACMTSGFLGLVFCIMVSMAAIGLGWTIAAVVFGGVPVIFIAIGVLIYHHTWPLLAVIGIYIVVAAVAGWYGEYLEDHAGEQDEYDRDFFDACDAFTSGKDIWLKASQIKGEGWKEGRNKQAEEALEHFDKAARYVEGLDNDEAFSGFDISELYSMRGSCLNDLEFYFDALEDYNKAIENNPRKGIAGKYFMRSQIKDSLFDFDGKVADLKEAVRLSKLDNEDNRLWNDYAKSTGFRSYTVFLETVFPTDNEIKFRKRHYTDLVIAQELKKIKRRPRSETNSQKTS